MNPPGRIRVLHIVTGIAIGDQCGGAEQIAVRIASRLDRSRFDVAVFAMRCFDSPTETIWGTHLADTRTPLFGMKRRTQSGFDGIHADWQAAWSAVEDFRPDIIHSHSDRGDALNILLHILHPTHPLAVRTLHLEREWQTHPRIGLAFSQFLFPLLFAGEVSVSNTVCQLLDRRPLARLLRKRSAVIFPAIDDAPYRQRGALRRLLPSGAFLPDSSTAPPPGIPQTHPLIGIVGRLTQQKGHNYLFQALARLVPARPISLLVIGSGELQDQLEAQARALGIADHVHFLGGRTDLPDILPHLDLFISASLWEGLPLVILEAMATQVPVIATDVSGTRDVVIPGQTGVLVPPGDAAALTSAIAAALDNPAMMRELALRASPYSQRFSLEHMVEEYAAVYQNVRSA